MKKFLLLLLVAAVVVGMLDPSAAVAQTRKNVKFVINTATVPDTLLARSRVVVTGATAKGDTTVLTNWGSGDSLANIGGDYWAKTLSLLVGDTLNYKIKVYGGGWEENINGPLANTNRNFIVPNVDTVLLPQYWNNGNFPVGKNIGVFDKPYTTVADTFISVYVRVNLKSVSDNGNFGWVAADKDSVCILGDGKGGPDLDWGTPFYLTQEKPPSNSGTAFGMPPNSFYSGRLRFRKSQVTAGTDVAYKFRLGSNWSYGSVQRSEQLTDPPYAGGNRHFKIPVGLKDTTLSWVYFSDARPVARPNPDTCVVTFRVDLKKAIDKGGFSPGDTVQVQSGFFGTAVESPRTKMLQQVIGSIYQVKDTIITKVGALLDYQYYINKLGQSTRENYYNFAYAGLTASEAERRQFLMPSKTVTVFDTSNSITSARRQPEFASTRLLARRVRVKYEVDLRPAYYQVFLRTDTLSDIQGTINVYKAIKDSIFKWGVWINGNAVGGWGNPNATDWGSGLSGNLNKKLYDDGTNGDRVAGDSIYTRTVICAPESVLVGSKAIVGQVFKFGIKGGDNEGGKGGYGNNHAENIVDTDTAYTISSQWGSINPKFYNAWDYDNKKPVLTGVQELPGLPIVYTLEQNYPNPFNPSTRIEFGIPQQANVELKVYNLLGQEVATLVRETLRAGRHVVTFDAKNLASGVYFYKISAGQFVSTKKMVLMK